MGAGPLGDHHRTRQAAIRPWQEEKVFVLLERGERKAVGPSRPTPASLRGVENKTLFSSDSRTLCQAQPLVGSFPALLAREEWQKEPLRAH